MKEVQKQNSVYEFSPMPWGIYRQHTSPVIHSAGMGTPEVCHLAHSSQKNYPQNEANAKLIAAAPELLDALIFCRHMLVDIGGFTGDVSMVDEIIIRAGGKKRSYKDMSVEEKKEYHKKAQIKHKEKSRGKLFKIDMPLEDALRHAMTIPRIVPLTNHSTNTL